MKGFKSIYPPRADYYRLPWSKNDNPIGWLEITDECNLHCKGCYRQRLTGHKALAEIKEEILFFKRWRNCDNISISGGEPLIHPDIESVVEFTAETGMKPIVLTNAVNLTRERLRELKDAGLAGLTIHIDSLQDRPGWRGKNEAELNRLRKHYAELVNEEKGIYCSFNSTVYYSNFKYIPEMVKWASENIDIVNGIIFITYRGAPINDDIAYVIGDRSVDVEGNISYTTSELSELDIMSIDIYTIIKNSFEEYEPCSYLGGTASHDAYKWLIATMLGSKKEVYGSVGKRTMELSQAFHHLLWGTYVAYPDLSKSSEMVFLSGLFDQGVRKAFGKFMRSVSRNPGNLFRKVYLQSVAIIQAPDLLPDGQSDMCDSCPDMTIYQGRLINSCRMDEYRKFGGFVNIAFRQDKKEQKTKTDVKTDPVRLKPNSEGDR